MISTEWDTVSNQRPSAWKVNAIHLEFAEFAVACPTVRNWRASSQFPMLPGQISARQAQKGRGPEPELRAREAPSDSGVDSGYRMGLTFAVEIGIERAQSWKARQAHGGRPCPHWRVRDSVVRRGRGDQIALRMHQVDTCRDVTHRVKRMRAGDHIALRVARRRPSKIKATHVRAKDDITHWMSPVRACIDVAVGVHRMSAWHCT